MSHYGSVNDVPPRSHRFRSRFMALSVAFAFLAGCGRHFAVRATPDPVLDTVASGYDAFRAGDRDALTADIHSLGARLPADKTVGDFVNCSPRRDSLRQIERARRKLEYLAAYPAVSMGEEERYVYFQQLIEGQIQNIDEHGHAADTLAGAYDPLNPLSALNAPSDFECDGASSDKLGATAASNEDLAIQAMGRRRMRDWLINLRRALNTQLNPRMQTAALELDEYQLRPVPGKWAPPGS